MPENNTIPMPSHAAANVLAAQEEERTWKTRHELRPASPEDQEKFEQVSRELDAAEFQRQKAAAAAIEEARDRSLQELFDRRDAASFPEAPKAVYRPLSTNARAAIIQLMTARANETGRPAYFFDPSTGAPIDERHLQLAPAGSREALLLLPSNWDLTSAEADLDRVRWAPRGRPIVWISPGGDEPE